MWNEDAEVSEAESTPAPAPASKKPKAKVKAKAVVKAKAPAKKAKANGHSKPKAVKARKARTVDASKLDQFGFRLGTIKSKAAAIYAAKNGATLSEVKDKLKSTQFNLLTEVTKRGFKVKRTPETGDTNRKVMRFKIATK